MTHHVAVVGGGVTGVGVARDLALRGLDVTLFERGGLDAGTSGRMHGLLHSGARYADTEPASARHCSQERRIIAALAPAAVSETGGLFLTLSGDDAAYAARKRAACEDCGIPVEQVDAPRHPDAVEAFRVPDAVVSPGRLVAATADDARRRGAALQLHTPVDGFAVDGDRVVGVEVAGDVTAVDHVVNATGAWAGRVASRAGCALEMAPTAGAMVVVARRVDQVLNRCRPPSDGDIVVPHGDHAILGTTSTPVTDPDDVPRDDAAVDRLLDRCRPLIPDVSRDEVVRSFHGVRPIPKAAGDGRDASRGFRVVDHAVADGVAGLTSVVGGKLTTHRLMAEFAADAVCDALGVAASCRTDEEPLPAGDEPARLDELAASFDAVGPADKGIVDVS